MENENIANRGQFILGDSIAVYNPMVALKLKGINSAVFLTTCLLRQRDNLKEEWLSFTIGEMTMATGLTRFQQELVVRNLKKLGLIEYKLDGWPAIRHFKLRWDDLTHYLG